MKRPKIKQPKPAPAPAPLPLIEYGDRITRLLAATDSDPDYERAKQIFSELLKEL